MSDPTTEAGKRLYGDLMFAAPELWAMHIDRRIREAQCEAKEQGARAERERLREVWTKAATEHFLIGTYSDRIVLALLAAPDR